MSDHALLSASGSAKWINCPGSIAMEEGLPNESSPYAAEGTAAHELASDCLEQGVMASTRLGDFIEADGEEWEVNADMVNAVQEYLDYCHSLEGQISFVETEVKFDNWVPEGWGTSDYIKINTLFDDATHTAHNTINVVDYKHGKGVAVDAEKNSQAMLYGLGVIQTFNLIYDFKPTDIVNCVVVQPRKFGITEYKISVGDLLKWAKEVVVPKAKEALENNATIKPGEKQCRFCLAKATCPTLALESMRAISEDFTDLTKEFSLKDKKKLTNTDIGIILGKIPAFRIWADSVEAYAYEQMNNGFIIPDYKLVQGKAGNKKWDDEDIDTLVAFLGAAGISEEEVVKRKIATPTAVEKILKSKKLKPALIKDLWSQSKGKPTIAQRSDKRDEIESQTSKKFKDLSNLI